MDTQNGLEPKIIKHFTFKSFHYCTEFIHEKC